MASPKPIHGLVRDPAGQAVPQARVWLESGPVPLPEIAALTDAGGAFTLTAPVPGLYSVRAAADGLGSQAVALEVGEEPEGRVEIVLGRG